VLSPRSADAPPRLPEFPETLDPADAEFENAVLEFYNGAYFRLDRAERTGHFATAIKSTVLARQINRWMADFPKEYEKWRSGRAIVEVTFLDDDAASSEAERAWTFVDAALKSQPRKIFGAGSRTAIAGYYRRWEESAS